MKAYIDDDTHELIIEPATDAERLHILASFAYNGFAPLPMVFRASEGEPDLVGFFKMEDRADYDAKMELARAVHLTPDGKRKLQ